MSDQELETEGTDVSPTYRIGELSVSEEGQLVSEKTETPYGNLYAEINNLEHSKEWYRQNYKEQDKKAGYNVGDAVVVIGEDEDAKPKQMNFKQAFDLGYSIITPVLGNIPNDYLRKGLSVKIRSDDTDRTYSVALWNTHDDGKERFAWSEILYSNGERLKKDGWGSILGLAVKNLDELKKLSIEIGGTDLTK